MTPDLATARARAYDIIKQKSFVRGEITLASGAKSDHYFNMKPTMLDPEGAKALCELILDRLSGIEVDAIGGLEMGAVPLIGPLALVSGLQGRPIPGFFVRKNVKGHGTRQRIEGMTDLAGKRVVVVEDVTTTGGSAMSAIEALRETGAHIALVISILDRQSGATELYRDAGIPFQSLFTSAEFLQPAS